MTSNCMSSIKVFLIGFLANIYIEIGKYLNVIFEKHELITSLFQWIISALTITYLIRKNIKLKK